MVEEVAMPRLVVGLNLGKEEKASSVLVACSFVSGSKSCSRSGPSGRSSSNNCCVGSRSSCRRQRSNRCGSGSNSWCCGSNNSNSKQINHSKGNSNINSFLSRAVAGSSSGSKNKMIVIMMILAAVVVLVEY